jgi:hypothetical protein
VRLLVGATLEQHCQRDQPRGGVGHSIHSWLPARLLVTVTLWAASSRIVCSVYDNL